MAKAPQSNTAENTNGRLDNQANTKPGEQATSQLGNQVKPESQLDEDNGNRTLAKPVTDPGGIKLTYEKNGDNYDVSTEKSTFKQPARENAFKPYRQLNDPMTIVQRHSTVPAHFAHDPEQVVNKEAKMAPDLAIHTGASDMYNKSGRKQGKEADNADPQGTFAHREREVAPQDATSSQTDPFAPA